MAAPAAPMNPPPGVVDPACIQYIQQCGPTGFGIQKASEPVVGPGGARVDQIWSGLHSHFDTSAIAVPPTQQIQGYGQPFGHVGQRCQDAPSWGESTIHWPFIGHRVGH